MVLTYLHFRILEFPLIFGWMIMNVHIIYCIYRDRLCSLWPGATEPWLLGGSPSQDRQKKCPPTDTTIFSESLRIARQSRPVPFLDKSIVFEFSYGVSKAEVRTSGKLLGQIGRDGASPDPERDQKQQFLCENWLCTGTFQLSLGAVPKCWLGIIYIYLYL